MAPVIDSPASSWDSMSASLGYLKEISSSILDELTRSINVHLSSYSLNYISAPKSQLLQQIPINYLSVLFKMAAVEDLSALRMWVCGPARNNPPDLNDSPVNPTSLTAMCMIFRADRDLLKRCVNIQAEPNIRQAVDDLVGYIRGREHIFELYYPYKLAGIYFLHGEEAYEKFVAEHRHGRTDDNDTLDYVHGLYTNFPEDEFPEAAERTPKHPLALWPADNPEQGSHESIVINRATVTRITEVITMIYRKQDPYLRRVREDLESAWTTFCLILFYRGQLGANIRHAEHDSPPLKGYRNIIRMLSHLCPALVNGDINREAEMDMVKWPQFVVHIEIASGKVTWVKDSEPRPTPRH